MSWQNRAPFAEDIGSRIPFGNKGYCIVPADPRNQEHIRGIGDRLGDQAQAHGRQISDERKMMIAKSVGQLYDARLACKIEGSSEAVLAIATTSQADIAQGCAKYLEDIVTDPPYRQQHIATHLIKSELICTWEMGLVGFVWETQRNNQNAKLLYEKFDPAFSTADLPSVWRLSMKQLDAFSKKDLPCAVLATPKNLNAIGRTFLMANHPDYDPDYMTDIVRRQEHNGLDANSFVVMSNDGSIAIVSQAYSTFEATMRADARLYLGARFEAAHITQLVKGVSVELARRTKWRGASAHFELCTDVADTSDNAFPEIQRLRRADQAMANAGCERVIHGGDDMVAYSLVGRRFIAAVIEAVHDLPEQPLTPFAKKRLMDAASDHHIALVAA